MFQKILKNIWIILIFLLIAANICVLCKIKLTGIQKIPCVNLNLTKPALIVLLQEAECPGCVENLRFLNDLYIRIEQEGLIDFVGIIFSKSNSDQNNISGKFNFPFYIYDNFSILKRLNVNRTPLILGMTEQHEIFYCEIVPNETVLNEEYIKRGVLERLYFSLGLKD